MSISKRGHLNLKFLIVYYIPSVNVDYRGAKHRGKQATDASLESDPRGMYTILLTI